MARKARAILINAGAKKRLTAPSPRCRAYAAGTAVSTRSCRKEKGLSSNLSFRAPTSCVGAHVRCGLQLSEACHGVGLSSQRVDDSCHVRDATWVWLGAAG